MITAEEYQNAKAELETIVAELHGAKGVNEVLGQWRRGIELQKRCREFMDQVQADFDAEEDAAL